MRDLIDRDRLLREIIKKEEELQQAFNDNRKLDPEYIFEMLVDAERVEAEEIIYCKDCKYWGVVDGFNWLSCKRGIITNWSNKGYGYCCYGSRRASNEEDN